MNTKTTVITIAAVALTAALALGGGIAYAQTQPQTWGPGSMMGGTTGAMWGQTSSASMMNWAGRNSNNTAGTGMMGATGAGMMNGASNAGHMNGAAGTGMMNGAGYTGNMAAMHQWMTSNNGLHTVVWNALAQKLGLTTDELNAQLAQGQTLAQIAEAKGVSQADLAQTLQTAMQAGLDQAVAAGTLTQAQADQMRANMAGRYAQMITYMSTGNCHGAPATSTNP